jgi:serine/threonine protein kinase
LPSEKVIHRDIKPDNIIRAKSGKLVLIDFGVSKQLTATVLSRIGTVTGSPGYAAPEQMQGQVFPASDLYSLAVTCIRLLTGCLLTESNGMITDELFSPMQMEWVWRQKVTVSDDLGQVLDKMLSFKVGDRYQSAADVLQALNSNSPAASGGTLKRSLQTPSVPSTVISSTPTKLSVNPSAASGGTLKRLLQTPSAAKTFHYEVVKLDRNGNITSRNSPSNRATSNASTASSNVKWPIFPRAAFSWVPQKPKKNAKQQ